jgi:hypothetical protein
MSVVLVLISFLNYSNYRKTYLEQNLARYIVTAKDLRQTVESGLNIGLFPSENLQLLPVMHEMESRHDGIRYVGVVTEGGLISAGNPPAALLRDWQERLAAAPADTYWQEANADTIQLGMPFVNDFGQKAGAIVVGYDKLAIERAASLMLRKLGLHLLITLPLVALLTFAAVYLLTHSFASQLMALGAAIDHTLDTDQPPQLNEALLGEGVMRDINDFIALSNQALHDIAQAEQALAQPGGAP